MKLRHYDHDGRARFVTFNTHKRIPVLTDASIDRIVAACILSVCRRRDVRLLAYVIMPEHVHLVAIPPVEARLGTIVGEMKLSSAMRIHELLIAKQSSFLDLLHADRDGRKKFCLWQRRCYDRNCRTEEEVWEKVNYCHNNPVKRGLVSRPEDWQWSSCRSFIRNDDALPEIEMTTNE
jgi:putative transposase